MIIKLKELNEKEIIKKIKKGEIFIYPTDTIYGIGCDATNYKDVKRLRKLKKSKKPFSIIVSKKWVIKNCFVDKKVEKYLKKLPGPYTFILKLKNKKAISREVNLNSNTIGIRIPKHIFTKIIFKANIPFITTSCNISGEKYIRSVKEVPEKFKNNIIIEDGLLKGKPSKIVDLTGKIKLIRK